MSSRQPSDETPVHTNQLDDLTDEMAELDDVIRRHTRELLWLNALVFGLGLMMLCPGLLLTGLAGFGAVWAMRRHKLIWVGLALSTVCVGLTAMSCREPPRGRSRAGWTSGS